MDHPYPDHTPVRLIRDVPGHGLRAGMLAAVLEHHDEDGLWYVIEVFDGEKMAGVTRLNGCTETVSVSNTVYVGAVPAGILEPLKADGGTA